MLSDRCTCSYIKNLPRFPKAIAPFYAPINDVRVPMASHPHQPLLLSVFLVLTVLVGGWCSC